MDTVAREIMKYKLDVMEAETSLTQVVTLNYKIIIYSIPGVTKLFWLWAPRRAFQFEMGTIKKILK
jgi:hypothetical protein